MSDDRIAELLRYNNHQVEKRRAAAALLREAGELFRMYEGSHRAKAARHEWNEAALAAGQENALANRNADIAGRIETFLAEIHS